MCDNRHNFNLFIYYQQFVFDHKLLFNRLPFKLSVSLGRFEPSHAGVSFTGSLRRKGAFSPSLASQPVTKIRITYSVIDFILAVSDSNSINCHTSICHSTIIISVNIKNMFSFANISRNVKRYSKLFNKVHFFNLFLNVIFSSIK